jgi:O-methyltransferase involved in polyketide biosynthesis
VTGDESWRNTFRPDIPSAARVYDYLLGGKDNYPADRKVGEAMKAQLPNLLADVQANRAFLRRVVRYLITEAGINQIVDVGAGLPTAGNTHEVALEIKSQARVVYVDHDPVVLAHGRDMLQGLSQTTIIAQDLCTPDEILGDDAFRSLIDVTQPVAFLFLSMLHFVPDSADPARLIARLLEPFPSGSYVALSHGTADTLPQVNDVERLFDQATESARVRSGQEILQLVAGLDLVEPGMVFLPRWRPELDPDEHSPGEQAGSIYYGLVARKPLQERELPFDIRPPYLQVAPLRQVIQVGPGQPVVRRGPERGQCLLMRGCWVAGVLREREAGVHVGERCHVPVPVHLGDDRSRRDRYRAQIRLDLAAHRPRPPDVVVRPVKQHRVGPLRQCGQRANRGPPQRDGHSRRVDLLVGGLADGVRRDPAQQFIRDRLPARPGEQLRIGKPRGRRPEVRGNHDGAHRHRSRPRAPPHLVDTRDAPGSGAVERTLDVIPGDVGRAIGSRIGRAEE